MANRRILLIGLVVIGAVLVLGLALLNPTGNVSATTQLSAPEIDTDGFTRAIEPYDWQFPADFGPHPDFQTEWWYYTGNVAAEDGRRFGFQFTVFRRAITPEQTVSNSEWRSNQLYLAHFTISDIATQTFYHDQRFSRAGADLAGATVEPRYRVWLEDWEIQALNDDASQVRIHAISEDFALDVTLQQVKPPALQGDGGLSPKSGEVGNASYYYTLSRLLTDGTITLGDEHFEVSGTSWKDHEFSTSALGAGAQGWDWFGLIFDNDHELMIGQIRLVDGGKEPAFGGLLIYPDGSTEYLDADRFTITPTATWTSPHTGADYPAGWDISIRLGDLDTLDFRAEPLMADQELSDTDPSYWEGAVAITGDVTGYGYAELTGYTQTMQNRF